MDLTLKDYKTILEYYNIDYSFFKKNKIISTAENILAEKLCRCIKKVTPPKNDKIRAIGICRNSVIQKKGLTINKFRCKKKPKLLTFNKTKKKIKKKNKRLTIKNRKGK
tara:strand:- start:5016 stop:5342 length:327 start_codon:yes stop_codon:yes gene_type:complete